MRLVSADSLTNRSPQTVSSSSSLLTTRACRHEVDEHVEDLRLDGDAGVGAPQLVEIEIQLDSGEREDQRAAPSDIPYATRAQ